MTRIEEVMVDTCELPKIPNVVGLQGPSRRRKTFQWLKGLRCVLVDYPKSQG